MSSPTRTQKEKEAKAALIADLKMQLHATEKSRKEKLEQSVVHLAGQLATAKAKYKTVNGFMQARSTIDQVAFGKDVSDVDHMSRNIAQRMSAMAGLLEEKIIAIDIEELSGDMLDEYVDDEFIENDRSIQDTALQLLVFNLLQNVGPVIDEIIAFRDGSQAEVDRISAALAEATEATPKLSAVDGGKQAN